MGCIRRAASRPHMASSSAITSNISHNRSALISGTVAPLLGRTSSSPTEPSWMSASRTGVRDTPKLAANSCSSRRIPGA